jgi:hypothetical protein
MGLSRLLKKTCSKQKRTQTQIWGWAFELKFDSLLHLDFKEVACIHNYLESSKIERTMQSFLKQDRFYKAKLSNSISQAYGCETFP